MGESNTKGEDRSPIRRDIPRDILLILVGMFLAWIGSLALSIYQGKQQVNFQRYSLTTGFHCKIAELFNEAEYLADQLVQKYGFDKVQNRDIPQEDLDKLNEVVKQLNTQLSSMFLLMPDDAYQNIPRAVPVVDVGKLKDFKERLLCEMRKAQFPETAYAAPENIRFFYYWQRKK